MSSCSSDTESEWSKVEEDSQQADACSMEAEDVQRKNTKMYEEKMANFSSLLKDIKEDLLTGSGGTENTGTKEADIPHNLLPWMTEQLEEDKIEFEKLIASKVEFFKHLLELEKSKVGSKSVKDRSEMTDKVTFMEAVSEKSSDCLKMLTNGYQKAFDKCATMNSWKSEPAECQLEEMKTQLSKLNQGTVNLNHRVTRLEESSVWCTAEAKVNAELSKQLAALKFQIKPKKEEKEESTENFSKLSDTQRQFLHQIVGERKMKANGGVKHTYLTIASVDIKKRSNHFFRETITYEDGTIITSRWRPDGVIRNGIRARFENGLLAVYGLVMNNEEKLYRTYGGPLLLPQNITTYRR